MRNCVTAEIKIEDLNRVHLWMMPIHKKLRFLIKLIRKEKRSNVWIGRCPCDILKRLFLFFLMANLSLVSKASKDGLTLHVSPQGNDTWNGLLSVPNVGETDGPLATLGGARDALRRMRYSGRLPQGKITVQFEQGRYGTVCSHVCSPVKILAPRKCQWFIVQPQEQRFESQVE